MKSVFTALDNSTTLYNHILQILFMSIKIKGDKAISGCSLVGKMIKWKWGALFIQKLNVMLVCTWSGTLKSFLINVAITFEDM